MNNVIAEFGGEERCRELFPEIFKAITSPELDTLPGDANMHILAAGYKKGDSKTIEITAEMSSQPSFYKQFEVTARCKRGDQKTIATAKTSSFLGGYASLFISIPAEYRDNCVIDMSGIVVSGNVTQTQHRENLSNIGLLDPDIEVTFEVNDPAIKKARTGENKDKIVYSYWRGGDSSTADYVYSKTTFFMLPSKGSITLKNSGFNPTITSAKIGCLRLINLTTKETHKHTNATGVSYSGNKVEWNFPEDWGFSPFRQSSEVIYDLQLECRLNNDEPTYYFTVSNDPNVHESNVNKIIPIIKYYYDCIAVGTTVALKDGTAIQIEKIKAGQILAGGSKVVEVLELDECCELYKLTVKGGRSIVVSAFHPVITAEGPMPADMLTPGMQIVMDNGKAELERIEPTSGAAVRNLQLEGGNGIIIANGFAVEGITSENMQAPDGERLRNMIDKKWLRDFDNLYKMKKGELLWQK
ncbi:MAG: Hint domain-containing protein [Fibromonadales bacterium]|nr:Hint domain-containing protein [Fibromonadales bacterium]